MNSVHANENNLKKLENILLSQQETDWGGNTEPGLYCVQIERLCLLGNVFSLV